jgi:opacity protein-like surface antigen
MASARKRRVPQSHNLAPMKMKSLLLTTSLCTLALQVATAADTNWQSRAISPVVNPLFFESPLIQSEVRPLFAYHRFDEDFLGVNAYARVYAVQLRYAVNDRLALLATKDGYMEIRPHGGRSMHGWNDIGAGLKYAVYRDDEKQLQITPGLTFELHNGDDEVFQGNGAGEFNLFVSAIKGFGNWHVTANVGARVPIDFDEETANIRTALQLDYYTCQYFIPFVTLNTFTTISEGEGLAAKTEGFDVVNFGSQDASGRTQLAAGLGFRTRLHERVDFGVAYEYGFLPDNDIFKDRITADFIFRF